MESHHQFLARSKNMGRFSVAFDVVNHRDVVAALGLPESGRMPVRFADGRQDEEPVIGDVQVEIQGRSSVFTAIVEPNRANALIGAFVLEELDFVPDRTASRLVPRDPRGIFTEIE